MTGIGNDIVDLKYTDPKRTIQPKFYSKILSAAEGQLYNPSFQIPLAQFVWLLWSVKESAYKCLQRQQLDLVFSPVKIEVHDIIAPVNLSKIPVPNIIESIGFGMEGYFQCSVSFDGETLCARSIIYGDKVIHTMVCTGDSFENIWWGIKHTDETDQSAAVRSYLMGRLNMRYPEKNIGIEKIDGIPSISIDKMMLPVSLSHHGNYVGYSFAAGSGS